jgi:hypothetical protein
MDLSALGSTLPPGLEDAEQEMGNKFRGEPFLARSADRQCRRAADSTMD